MKNERIFLSAPHMSGKELKYVEEVFKTNYIAPVGKYIDMFENKIKEYTKINSALAVINGTSAIHLALRVLGITNNDKILTSSFTFIGSVSSILFQNAEPIFIDSDKNWNIDTSLLEDAIKKEHPKALIITHLYGQISNIEDIVFLCKKYKVFLIEDAAESLGATYKTKESGTFGDFGIYSFNGNKILTTSSGGMLISDNEKWIKKAKFLSTQAKNDSQWYEHTEIGYNYRISNILAAIGVGQMEVLKDRIKRKREIFNIYKKELSDIIDFMPEIEYSKGNRWLTTGILKKETPQKIIKRLEKQNIESRYLWKPMHLQKLFQNNKSYTNGISENLFKKGICLPSGTNMNDQDIMRIIKYVKN